VFFCCVAPQLIPSLRSEQCLTVSPRRPGHHGAIGPSPVARSSRLANCRRILCCRCERDLDGCSRICVPSMVPVEPVLQSQRIPCLLLSVCWCLAPPSYQDVIAVTKCGSQVSIQLRKQQTPTSVFINAPLAPVRCGLPFGLPNQDPKSWCAAVVGAKAPQKVRGLHE